MPLAVPEVTDMEVPSCRYIAVVLSTTTKEALGGTDATEMIGYAVPPAGADPCATAPFE